MLPLACCVVPDPTLCIATGHTHLQRNRTNLQKSIVSPTSLRALCVVAFLCFCTVVVAPSTLPGQTPTSVDARVEANRLRNSGDFAGAVSVLRAHLAANPDDGDALRLLAETLYWQKHFIEAREISERALALHPDDTALRLQYARMLMETGFPARAREVLAGVTSASSRGRSDAILSTLAYWNGDLVEANRLAELSIAAGDSDSAIRRIHADIAVLTAPWIGVTPSYQHDDQPIDRESAAVEAGWFPLASTSIAIRAQGFRFQLGDTATRTAELAELALSHYVAAARMEMVLSAGAVARSFGSSSDVVGSAGVAWRLPIHVKVGVRGQRLPYFETESSLSQSVMTNTGIAYAHLDNPHGWLGEAAVQYEQFPDSNSSTDAYVWLLAPLVHSQDLSVRAGYAASVQTSASSRFSLANPNQPFLPGDSRFDLAGAYQPYYTPIDLQSHSAVAAIEAHPGPLVTFNANGSYAFHATESHPVLLVVTTGSPATSRVERLSYTRSFNPWDAHASLELKPGNDVRIVASGFLFRTGFYSATGASVGLVYSFAERAIRQAGGY
jgi:Putative Zn-dependent protease, contains TPR repeats